MICNRIRNTHLQIMFRFLEFLNAQRNVDEYTRIVSQTSAILRQLESMDEGRSGSGISLLTLNSYLTRYSIGMITSIRANFVCKVIAYY